MIKIIGCTGLLALAGAAFGDEGLWLFNAFPRQMVKDRYGSEVSDAFMDKLRLASVRFNNGGSGSFISQDGLLFTNHHVGNECVQKLSSATHDYMANGFYAATAEDEKACPDFEVNVLLRIEDMTAKVNTGITSSTAKAEALRLRNAAMSKIEKECTGSSGNRCDVVTLYSGGQYHLYEYKKYTDIRLVFAPEYSIAAFGGDPDNFTYPRYCLDFALFRAYENGKPAKPRDFFRWSREGVREGELVFVPGHPGTTGRLLTVAQLEFNRDHYYPMLLRRFEAMSRALERFSASSPENQRLAVDKLQYEQNSLKAYTGFLAGLRDRELIAQKSREEQKLRAAVAADAKMRAEFGAAWDDVAAAQKTLLTIYKPFRLLETLAPRSTALLEIARDVVRYAAERSKPDAERLREFVDSALPSLEQTMYSAAPISNALEIAVLATYFEVLKSELGAADPTVRAILADRTAQAAAEHYVKTSKLADVSERKRLAASQEAVRKSDDGMIRLALILDERARKLRKQYEDEVEAIEKTSAGKIALARYALEGSDAYPDATFTLRLSFARVKGYRTSDGEEVPYATRIEGVYRRATGTDPFKLPPSWIRSKPRLDMRAPFNFVSTADTHGGNSGSPTLNARGEIVGILFDGNLESLPNRFVYTEERARSLHVASQVIVEALRKVYGAERLLKEIGM
jgi:hypothetical protein